jgi:hypothetical protein
MTIQNTFTTLSVTSGLTLHGAAWAFAHSHCNNWHPLTWLSHMLDWQLYGRKAGGHHFTNMLLHTIGVVLLFLVLRQMTGAVWRSAFVAALFAIHPLHVESVAWIAERKDLLSGVFFLLTLGAYVWYVRKRTLGNYAAMCILFTCGLMSKPMLVTLPFILLLLDYWPLDRFRSQRSEVRSQKSGLFGRSSFGNRKNPSVGAFRSILRSNVSCAGGRDQLDRSIAVLVATEQCFPELHCVSAPDAMAVRSCAVLHLTLKRCRGGKVAFSILLLIGITGGVIAVGGRALISSRDGSGTLACWCP